MFFSGNTSFLPCPPAGAGQGTTRGFWWWRRKNERQNNKTITRWEKASHVPAPDDLSGNWQEV